MRFDSPVPDKWEIFTEDIIEVTVRIFWTFFGICAYLGFCTYVLIGEILLLIEKFLFFSRGPSTVPRPEPQPKPSTCYNLDDLERWLRLLKNDIAIEKFNDLEKILEDLKKENKDSLWLRALPRPRARARTLRLLQYWGSRAIAAFSERRQSNWQLTASRKCWGFWRNNRKGKEREGRPWVVKWDKKRVNVAGLCPRCWGDKINVD